MTIEDIYGCDYVTEHINLPNEAVASSFGKMVNSEARGKFVVNPFFVVFILFLLVFSFSFSFLIDLLPLRASREDLARACLATVTNNIGSIAYLHSQLSGVKRIIFAGSFLVDNVICMKSLAYAMHFWSKGKVRNNSSIFSFNHNLFIILFIYSLIIIYFYSFRQKLYF